MRWLRHVDPESANGNNGNALAGQSTICMRSRRPVLLATWREAPGSACFHVHYHHPRTPHRHAEHGLEGSPRVALRTGRVSDFYSTRRPDLTSLPRHKKILEPQLLLRILQTADERVATSHFHCCIYFSLPYMSFISTNFRTNPSRSVMSKVRLRRLSHSEVHVND